VDEKAIKKMTAMNKSQIDELYPPRQYFIWFVVDDYFVLKENCYKPDYVCFLRAAPDCYNHVVTTKDIVLGRSLLKEATRKEWGADVSTPKK
jgi:hypothetical protein